MTIPPEAVEAAGLAIMAICRAIIVAVLVWGAWETLRERKAKPWSLTMVDYCLAATIVLLDGFRVGDF